MPWSPEEYLGDQETDERKGIHLHHFHQSSLQGSSVTFFSSPFGCLLITAIFKERTSTIAHTRIEVAWALIQDIFFSTLLLHSLPNLKVNFQAR